MDELLDFLQCHNCKQDPSIAGHFDFILPENNEGPYSNMHFSAVIEMSTEMSNPFIYNWFSTRMQEVIMQAQIDMYTVSVTTHLNNFFEERAFSSDFCKRPTLIMHSYLPNILDFVHNIHIDAFFW